MNAEELEIAMRTPGRFVNVENSTMMTPEKIAEWRKFALEAIPQLSQLSDESESERIIISTCATAILQLIDALSIERERAEKAEEKFKEAVELSRKMIQEIRLDHFPSWPSRS